MGFQAWRPAFDAILLNRARQLGVKVFQPSRVLRPLIERNRVLGVETSDGTLLAPYVVDAMGSQNWLARHIGLRIETVTPQLIVWYGYAAGACPGLDHAPALTADAKGWTWAARVRAGVYHWANLPLENHSFECARPPKELEELTEYHPRRGADVSWRTVRAPAGTGYFMVGDAAAVLDPVSSHGVLRALMSGMMTAHLIASVLTGKISSAQAATTYTRWILDWFFSDAREMCKLYAKLPSPPVWLEETARRTTAPGVLHQSSFGSSGEAQGRDSISKKV